MQLGDWFELEEGDSVPDFISPWSYQRNENGDKEGWKPSKKDIPDIWIHPDNSFVLTLNAAELNPSESMSCGFCLRFPRITAIRAEGYPGGSKKHEDCQAFTELLTLHTEYNHGRGRGQEQFQSKATTSRFLTEKQWQKCGKQLKAKMSRKATNEVKSFHIPNVVRVLSHALDGYLFTVLPGNYSLDNDGFTSAEAEENGWANEAKSVTSRDDVIQFIKSHGGRCELSVHVGSDYVLGGVITDAQVVNLKNLIDSINEDTVMEGTKKTEAPVRRLFQMGGVTKWTFPFSIVSKFLNSLGSNASLDEKSIKKYWPTLARPRRSDYLVMTKAAATSLNDVEDDYGLRINELSNFTDFQRALEEVGRQTSKRQRLSLHTEIARPWQLSVLNDFDESDRSIFGGKLQALWPYAEKASTPGTSLTIIYPDLFVKLGLEDEERVKMEDVNETQSRRWDEVPQSKKLGPIAASLPLAKVMGAIVTPHLHSGVTHVLCEMKRNKSLAWSSTLPRNVFTDPTAGSRLRERLLSLEESATFDRRSHKGVLLVTPEWLEEKWGENQRKSK